MKLLKKYGLYLLALPLIVVACMTIEEIIHPDDAQVNSDIDIYVKIKHVAETDGNSKLAFGILVPKSWNVSKNASLTLTTVAGFAANAVTDEPMKVISTEANPSDAQTWANSFQSKFGVLGNTGPMEWVVFESATTFQIHDGRDGQKQVEGTVHIRLHTGDRAVRFNMGYTFCGKAYGYHSEKYPSTGVLASKVLEVTGGDEPLWDYTADPAVSYVPATFGFNDIFSIRYNEPHSVTEGGMKGHQAYMLGKVIYEEDGVIKEKSVTEKSAKTLMEELGDLGKSTTWQKYIYPKDFFGLPKNAEVIEIQVHFESQDGSVVVLDNATEADFVITETCE